MLIPSPASRHRISNALSGAKLIARRRAGRVRAFRRTGRLLAHFHTRLANNARNAQRARLDAYFASFD